MWKFQHYTHFYLAEILQKIQDEKYVRTPIPSKYSTNTRNLIDACLRRDPDKRINIDEFLARLNEYRFDIEEEKSKSSVM